MRTKQSFDPDDRLPSFLSDHSDEHAQLRKTFEHELWGTPRIFKASVLAVIAIAGGGLIALSLGFPAKLFADAMGSLPDTSGHSTALIKRLRQVR